MGREADLAEYYKTLDATERAQAYADARILQIRARKAEQEAITDHSPCTPVADPPPHSPA